MSNTEENATLQNETDRIYEAGVHFLPNLSADEVTEHFTNLKKAIEDGKGEIISEETPARMTLAYAMERELSNKKELHTQSYFGWVKFTGSSDLVLEIQETLRENDHVLRSMVTKTGREDVFYHEDEEVKDEEEAPTPEEDEDEEVKESPSEEKDDSENSEESEKETAK